MVTVRGLPALGLFENKYTGKPYLLTSLTQVSLA